MATAAGSPERLFCVLALTGWEVEIHRRDFAVAGHAARERERPERFAAWARDRESLALLMFEHAFGAAIDRRRGSG